ncbi:hypothetical protein RhiirA4_447592 [Rhizophagus irregularis]|uniref:Uncharacterized protein n=1 Tax=Rhizophagus irregularis TaxID=588596 RepID=A0A2I1H3C1_9GLOM|nr:hypothetical protein RhiirA4_447592 [Rhizophagus irregularis]
MPNKKFNKKPQPVAEVSNPIFNATTLNDFTNLQLFLQQQSQILALNEAIRQEKASSSIDYNNPVAISPDYATSTSILHQFVLESHQIDGHQQKFGYLLKSPVLKERSKASIQQKWDTVFQKYREYFL